MDDPHQSQHKAIEQPAPPLAALRWQMPVQSRFLDLLRAVRDYAGPLKETWPYFWLNAAAVRDGLTWHTCVFTLSGRWNDAKPAPILSDVFETIAISSWLLDAASLWSLIEQAITTESLPIASEIIATLPNLPIPPVAQWQERAHPRSAGELAQNVVEQATWWYLNVGHTAKWLDDPSVYTRIDVALRPDLDRVSEQSFATFIWSRFGSGLVPPASFPAFDQFQYHIDLPLALLADVGVSDRFNSSRDIAIACRAPLHLDRVQVSSGPAWTSQAQASHVIQDTTQADTHWQYGHAPTPLDAPRLWFSTPQLFRHLPLDLPSLAPQHQLEAALGAMYAGRSESDPEVGRERWHHALTAGSGAEFEIALSNALSRLGIPVLFGGQVLGMGPETPGIDLVALDASRQRAVAISAKGSDSFPKGNDINNAVRAADALAHVLSGWTIFPLIACRASPSLLSQFSDRTDIRVWGLAEIETIMSTDTPQAIKRLLWMPPWIGPDQAYLYYS